MGDRERIWSTTGVDPDIIAATLSAIVESYEYGLLLRRPAGLLPAGGLQTATPAAEPRAETQVGGASTGAAGNVKVQPRGEGRLPIVILNEIDPGRSEIGA
jgi:hypothetical protein